MDKIKLTSLSIVIPTFNETKRIGFSLLQVDDFITRRKINDYEIIISDDGSTDSTIEAVKLISRVMDIKNVIIVKNKHHGKGYAVKQGVKKVTKEWFLVTDCDLATPLQMIDKFIESSFFSHSNLSIFIGSRNLPKSVVVRKSKTRSFLGKMFPLIVNGLFNLGIMDTQCGFKLFSKHTKILFLETKTNGFSYDVEVLWRAKHEGFNYVEVPVIWIHNEDSRVRPLRDGIKMLFELGNIWLNIHINVKRYIKFAIVGAIGTVCSGITLYILTDWFRLWYMFSFIFGTVIGSIINYLLNKKFVWNVR